MSSLDTKNYNTKEDKHSFEKFNTIEELKDKYKELSTYCKSHGLNGISDKIESKLKDLSEPLYIMIVGIGNHGKSTLINALVNKNVAEVAIRPKTWKIDIYQGTDKEEYAELTWIKNNEMKVEKTTIKRASEISNEIEKTQKNKSKSIEKWRSSLKQVKWFINSNWPRENSVLIDTPGFNQLRADTSIKLSTLYNAKGIQIEREDGFSYYYYRADIVLWCIRAGKLQDRETLEKLEEVYNQNKIIIGVITAIDLIPENRREDIMEEAQKLFGKYICEFVMSAAGSKDDILKEKTINDIKKVVGKLTNGNENSVKIKDANHFYYQQLKGFKSHLGNIADLYTKNIIKYYDILDYINDKQKLYKESVINKSERFLEKEYSNLMNSLDDIWRNSEDEPEKFSKNIQKRIENLNIENKIKTYVKRYDDENKSLIDYVQKNTNWTILRLSSKKIKKLNLDESTVSLDSRELDIKKFNIISNDVGFDEGIKAGFFSGLAGAFLLGPLGLALGGIGFLVSGYFKKKKCIDSAEEHITMFISNIDEKLKESVNKSSLTIKKNIEDYINTSFKEYNGGNPKLAYERIMKIEKDFNELNLYEKENLKYMIMDLNNSQDLSSFLFGKTKYIDRLNHLPIMNDREYKNRLFIDLLFKEVGKDTRNIYKEYFNSFSFDKASFRRSIYEEIGNIKLYHELDIIEYPIVKEYSLGKFIGSIRNNHYFKTKYNNTRFYLKNCYKKMYEKLEKEWKIKVKEYIEEEINNKLGFIRNEYYLWEKEANIILNEQNLDKIQLLDFKEFLKYRGLKEKVDLIINKKPEENIDERVYSLKWIDGVDCTNYINDYYKKVLNKIKIQLDNNNFKLIWDNKVKKLYEKELVRILKYEQMKMKSKKEVKKYFKKCYVKTVDRIIEKNKKTNGMKPCLIYNNEFQNNFNIRKYFISLFPDFTILHSEIEKDIVDLPLFYCKRKSDITRNIYNELIDSMGVKENEEIENSYDFNKIYTIVPVFISITGLVLDFNIILIILGLGIFLYRVINKKRIFNKWFEKIDDAILKHLNQWEEK